MDAIDSVFKVLRHMPPIIWASTIALLQWFIPRAWYAKDVSNDIILITGAGSGLGRGIALEYAKLNASLVLWDINGESLEQTRKLVEAEHQRVSGKNMDNEGQRAKRFCNTYIVDVSRREEVYAKAAQVQQDLNDGVDLSKVKERYVSVLVNNAGIYHGLHLQELSDDQIERVFKINIISHFWTVKAFLPKMIEYERGHIVEIASVGGIAGMHKQVDYCASKFAAVGFEESLSIELEALGLGDKIHTSAICPLFFRSNLFTGFNSKAASIMSCNYVAREAVMSMRCNHYRVLLPPSASLLTLIRPLTPRKALYSWAKMLGFDEGMKTIKGAAAS